MTVLNDVIEYHDLTICLSGILCYEIDGTQYRVCPGDCIYIKPGSRRRRFSYSPQLPSYVSINLIGTKEELCPFVQLHDFVDKTVLEFISYIDTAFNTRNFDKFVVLSEYLLYDMNEKFHTKKLNPTVLSMQNFILNNILKKLTVDDVARHVYLSKEYCETLFKRETGLTIITYINQEKVNRAKNFLLQSEMSLIEISDVLGYSDYNYFSRVFRKFVGKTPLQYKLLK